MKVTKSNVMSANDARRASGPGNSANARDHRTAMSSEVAGGRVHMDAVEPPNNDDRFRHRSAESSRAVGGTIRASDVESIMRPAAMSLFTLTGENIAQNAYQPR